jgi:hypothetical protein
MLCSPPPTLNPVTIFEAARLPYRANPSRAAGSFYGHLAPNPSRSMAAQRLLKPDGRRPALARRRLTPAENPSRILRMRSSNRRSSE